MTPTLNENHVEAAALDYFRSLGYEILNGTDMVPDGDASERSHYGDVVLTGRLHKALERINPHIPPDALNEAVRKVLHPDQLSLNRNNRTFHQWLVDGIPVSWGEGGEECHNLAWLVQRDPKRMDDNEFLAVNQFTVIENKRNRRPDIVIFVNGLPLGIVELKNPTDEQATLHHAYNQIQTYKADIPGLFIYNEAIIISDGLEAKIGTLTAAWDRFVPWRTVDGITLAPPGSVQLDVLAHGVFEKARFLDYILNFITYEDDGRVTTKKAAAYHQYWAVNKAVEMTIQASAAAGDRRVGVIWHTQGSGKSLSMLFYAGKIISHAAMQNPTLVIVTDRNDLDEQLFGTFSANSDLLRQTPVQAESRDHLKEQLRVASGGVVFTTLQKFESGDALSERRNIVVIVDEAHRSHYGFGAEVDSESGEIKHGFAQHLRDALPNASFIGFTGTPLERDDKNTRAVFGDYIDTYDIRRAVEDGATVPIYYESRLARLTLDEAERPHIDPEFDEITEDEEEAGRDRLRGKWAALASIVGVRGRLALVAKDIIGHFEQRLEVMEGKAMIVCMSRRICVDLYSEIVKLRPGWHVDEDDMGAVKIVMSGTASDDPAWQQHVRDKSRREGLARRFKDPSDPLRLVIVRDMWLTGFDCPSLHTMYVDKPMAGHNLMQAIARVNRVFKDKPGGLVVDYLGIAEALKQALHTYTDSGGGGTVTVDLEEAVRMMREKYEVVCHMLHGFDYQSIVSAAPARRLQMMAAATDFVLGLEDGKRRFTQAVTALSKAFALAVPHEEAIRIRDEVGIFHDIRAMLMKFQGAESGRSPEEVESAICQLVSRSVAPTEVVDIFAAAEMEKLDISILSDEFLANVQKLPHKKLALELLKGLINDEIKTRMRKNVVQARSFTKMLERAIRKYQNRTLEAAEVIGELIDIARELNKARSRGEKLGLSEDEEAFYDALAENESAQEVIGDEKLKELARELVRRVQNSVTIDWRIRESARARIRVAVKRLLRQYGYPPDGWEGATDLVLEQAEVLCEGWEE